MWTFHGRGASRTGAVAAAVVVAGLMTAPPATAYAVALSPCEPSDHGYPVVSAVTFEPRRVDVRTASADVRVSVSVTDVGGPGPASGVASIRADFWGPNDGGPPIDLRSAGDGTWAGTLRVPRGVEGGTWTIGRLFLRDKAGNERWYEDATERFPEATVVIRSVKDDQRPQIESFTLSRSSADTRGGPVKLRLRARLRDDVGIPATGFAVHGEAESSADFVTGLDRDLKIYWLHRVSGGPRHGVWAATVVMKRWDRPGPWYFGLDVLDRAGNWMSLDRSGVPMPDFRLVAGKDRDDPRAGAATISTPTVDVRGGDSAFTVSVRLRDRTSGIDAASIYSPDLTSPLGGPRVAARLRLVSGDRHDGIWRATVTVAHCGTPAGSVRLRLLAGDRVGHDIAQQLAVVIANDDTVDPRAELAVPVEDGVLQLTFDEPVTGLTLATGVVRATQDPGDPVAVLGTWACRDSGGGAVDCSTAAFVRASFTVAAGQPKPAYGYEVELNPEGTLGLTDLAGNAPRAGGVVTS